MKLFDRRPSIPRPSRHRTLAALLAAGALVGGCQSTTPIGTLLDDPARFEGKDVRVAGEVTSALGLFGMGTYELDDGTGTLQVVTEKGGTPRVGARVGVEGTFRSAFTIGSESLAVVVEKQRFTP